MDILPGRPFWIVFSNFSNREANPLKNMKIAHTANPHGVIHAVGTVDRNTAPKGTPEADENSIASEVSISIEVKQQHSVSYDVLAVHYNPSESRGTRISCHIAVRREESTQQAHNWQDEV